jgi:hypothetical protein
VKQLMLFLKSALLTVFTALLSFVFLLAVVWGWQLIFSTPANPIGILVILIASTVYIFGIKALRAYILLVKNQ